MTLREKLCQPFDGLLTETIDKLEKIVDEFSIGFAEWNHEHGRFIQENLTTKQLLEIYKQKQKHL